LEELADRLEIDDVLNLYVTALDNNRFELLDGVFTTDAHLSYADVGVDGEYPAVRDWLAARRPERRVWLHLVGNRRVSLAGDEAQSTTTFFFAGVDHDGNTHFTGGEYHDKLARTPDGWRIAERIEVQLWNSGHLVEIPPV
jgi:hypothetical protein